MSDKLFVQQIRQNGKQASDLGLLKPNVIIIDNFLPNPDAVREVALSKKFYKKTHTAYSCECSSLSYLMTNLYLSKVLPHIGLAFASTFIEAEFIAYNKQDEVNNLLNNRWVHFDPCFWVSMLFLNDSITPMDGGGIGFYQHKQTGLYTREQVLEIDGALKQTNQDSGALDTWDELGCVANVYNRLVIFNPHIFHQAKNYFGNSITTSRLTLNAYFGPTKTQP